MEDALQFTFSSLYNSCLRIIPSQCLPLPLHYVHYICRWEKSFVYVKVNLLYFLLFFITFLLWFYIWFHIFDEISFVCLFQRRVTGTSIVRLAIPQHVTAEFKAVLNFLLTGRQIKNRKSSADWSRTIFSRLEVYPSS